MCSRRQIASDWGVAKSYVDKCVTQRACPTTSLQDAREWREQNARRRAPTHAKRDQRELPSRHTNAGIKVISLRRAKAIAFDSYDHILELVDKLPEFVAARCNLADSQATLDVLKDECWGVLCGAADAYQWWANDEVTGVTNSASVVVT